MCIMAQHARGGVIGGERDETRSSSGTGVIGRPGNSEQSNVRKQSTDPRASNNDKSSGGQHQHMHTLAEIAEESHRTEEEQKQHHLDASGTSATSTASQMNPLVSSYCRSQWSLRTKASFRGYTNDLIHGRLRSYKIIHGSGSFKGRQHAQLWADTNSTVLWPQELTWRKLLHASGGGGGGSGFNSNTRFFIMGYTMHGRNKATFITEWPASADHSFR